MDSTETKYNFYKRTFKGGAQVSQETQSETINIQPQAPTQAPTQAPLQEEMAQTENQNQTQEQQNVQTETQGQPIATDGANLEKLNQEIPKSKISFKVSSIVGNLEQTLGSKQKINFDQLLMRQLFGSNY
jgi:hypothetical protein